MTHRFHNDELAVFIGETLRRLRKSQGLSQTQLGFKLGISFQQIQKYEKGTNRISVEALAEVAAVMKLPIMAFLPKDSTDRSENAGTIVDLKTEIESLKAEIASLDRLSERIGVAIERLK